MYNFKTKNDDVVETSPDTLLGRSAVLFFSVVFAAMLTIGTSTAPAQNSTNTPVKSEPSPTTEKSDSEKFQELKQKAEHGDATAQNNLGVCYANGQGVTKAGTGLVNLRMCRDGWDEASTETKNKRRKMDSRQ